MTPGNISHSHTQQFQSFSTSGTARKDIKIRIILCYTVEQYIKLEAESSPLDAMESLGFRSRRMKLYGDKVVA